MEDACGPYCPTTTTTTTTSTTTTPSKTEAWLSYLATQGKSSGHARFGCSSLGCVSTCSGYQANFASCFSVNDVIGVELPYTVDKVNFVLGGTFADNLVLCVWNGDLTDGPTTTVNTPSYYQEILPGDLVPSFAMTTVALTTPFEPQGTKFCVGIFFSVANVDGDGELGASKVSVQDEAIRQQFPTVYDPINCDPSGGSKNWSQDS